MISLKDVSWINIYAFHAVSSHSKAVRTASTVSWVVKKLKKPVADMVTVTLELELLRAMRDKTEVKIQMVMPLESKGLVFRLNQTEIVMLGCVILDLFHSIKKLGHIMTKLIRQFLTCLVKNDHCACMALRDLRLLRRPSKLNTTKAPQIKAKVMALSLVNGSP